MHQKFKLKYLGELKYLLGIEVLKSKSGVILNQRKYVHELVSELGLSGAKPAITPIESNLKLTTIEHDKVTGAEGDPLLLDVGLYLRLIRKLMYATITRPNTCYAIQKLSQFMRQLKRSHLEAALRVIIYIKN